MRKTKEKEIDGLLVRSMQLDASSSFKLFWKLGAVLSPALGKIGNTANFATMDIASLGSAFETLFRSLSPDEAMHMAREILACTTVQEGDKLYELGPGGKFDTVFQGRLVTLLKTLKFALEVNFGDFLAGALAQSPVQAGAKVEANA